MDIIKALHMYLEEEGIRCEAKANLKWGDHIQIFLKYDLVEDVQLSLNSVNIFIENATAYGTHNTQYMWGPGPDKIPIVPLADPDALEKIVDWLEDQEIVTRDSTRVKSILDRLNFTYSNAPDVTKLASPKKKGLKAEVTQEELKEIVKEIKPNPPAVVVPWNPDIKVIQKGQNE